MTSGLPFDDFRALLKNLPGPDDWAAAAARERQSSIARPAGALGQLGTIAEWLAAWSGRSPAVMRPLVALFAGNHGVAGQGIGALSENETARMVENTAAGGAAINQICIAHDLGLKVFDLALDVPTADITEEAALDERSCAATMAFGMEAIAGGTDLLCLGDIGAGNTIIAAAVCHGLYGGAAMDWIADDPDRGDDDAVRIGDAVTRAVKLHRPHLADPLEVLRRLGGRELAATAGAILAARMERIPVILDGYATCAAAAVLHAANPAALDHCLVGHVAAVPGHGRLLTQLGKRPLLDLDIGLGEGSGAALAAGLVKAAALCHTGMAKPGPAGSDVDAP